MAGKTKGRAEWIPTPEILKQIEADSALGFNSQTIAAGLGISAPVFSLKKTDFPEIIDAIEKGRRRGLSRFALLSWEVAQDLKYGQAERDRIARMLKAETTFNSDLQLDEVTPKAGGFTISVISKKTEQPDDEL